jgi:dishevelled associated activator of morphogenesis
MLICVQYDCTVRQFGEDPKATQPEEFFGTFDLFLTSFSTARGENEKFKRMKEDEEKRQEALVS